MSLSQCNTPDYTPSFRWRGKYLVLDGTVEAETVARRNKETRDRVISKDAGVVEKEARMRAGNVDIPATALLGFYELQFGQYRGQSFCWLLENAMGWTISFIRNMMHESGNTSPLGVNKDKLREYALSFQPVQAAVDFSCRVEAARKKAQETGDNGHRLLEFGSYSDCSWREVYESTDKERHRFVHRFIMPKTNCQPGSKMAEFRAYCQQRDTVVTTRSATLNHLTLPNIRNFRSDFSHRGFANCAPTIWNNLPKDITDNAITRDVFVKRLKTHLYRLAYVD